MVLTNQSISEFGQHSTSFVCQVLGAEWGCFYRLDERGHPYAFQPHRAPGALRSAYLEHSAEHFDPLHPVRLIQQPLQFISIFDPRLPSAASMRRQFWSFLSAFGSRDAAEMIFRVNGHAVAGMSLIWAGRSDPLSNRERGETVQSYVEYNLAAKYRALDLDSFREANSRQDLTNRERQVIRLVCEGFTNAQIADALNIGLATVKTHLIHVFHKFGVATRTALATRVLDPNNNHVGP